MKRKDIDIYDKDTFIKVIDDLAERYNCTFYVKKSYKISNLKNDYPVDMWMDKDRPYDLLKNLIESIIDCDITENFSEMVNKNDPIFKEDFYGFKIDNEWALSQLVVFVELYNELLSFPSMWPIVLHTEKIEGRGIQSLLHPGNNRWMATQYSTSADAVCDLIEIDYTHKDTSDIYDYFDELQYGIKVVEYIYDDGEVDELEHVRKIEFFAPGNLGKSYRFDCEENVHLEMRNGKLTYQGIPLFYFDHELESVRPARLSQENINNMVSPSWAYTNRDTIFKEHFDNVNSGNVKTTYYDIQEHKKV